mgnify:CR=1 FL=1
MTTTLVVLISGRGSNMEAIAHACMAGRCPARIALVVADRADAPGLAQARALGLACAVVPRDAHASRDAFDVALAEAVAAASPDWVVLAGFMRLLSDAFLSRFAGRVVNIHPSLLPAFPGLATHKRALEAGVRVHGATVHLVTPVLDSGPILAQAAVPVLDGDDEPRLADRVLAAEHRLYPRTLAWLAEGRLRLAGARCELQGVAAGERLLWAA